MPSDPITPVAPAAFTSDFAQFLLHERAKSIPIPKYELNASLRIWLRTFEQQAAVHGVTDLNHCGIHLSLYMPPIIQQWMPSLAPTVRASWSLLKESLLTCFGLPEEEDNRRLLQQLKRCKKNPKESIRLHATHWEYLLSLISEKYTETTKISYFIQSLDQRDTRLTLTALVAALKIDNISDVIKQAIDLEVQAKLIEDPEITRNDVNEPTPMDLDYVQYHSSKKQYYTKNKFQKSKTNQQQQLRAYDRDGNPICDHCKGKHRTIDCNRNQGNKNKDQPTSHKSYYHKKGAKIQLMQDNNSQEVNTTSPTVSALSVDIAYISKPHSVLPKTNVQIGKKQIPLLWDTGASITGIEKQLAKKMNLQINSTNIITYRDVNNNLKNTCGTTNLPIFGETITAHVIDGLSCPLIVGWDTISKYNGQIDAKNNTITLTVKSQQITISTALNDYHIQELKTVESQREVIAKQVLNKYDSVIAKDPERPSVTHLMEFSIDTGDSLPVYNKPKIFHPKIQQEVDDKLESMVKSGLLEQVQFSQWGSQVRPVEKPDGSMRVCGNYIRLNKVTISIKYPFPNMHYMLQSLGQATIFSKLDLAQGYFQIPIKKEHKEKTALVTVNGTYVFTVMPMGMKNAPAVFQSLMDRVLGPFRYSFAFAYLDDIIVYSKTIEEHKIHLAEVLEQLQNANLSIKLSKSKFILDSIDYLGFLVSKEGVSANPEKIKPIIGYKRPVNIKELERFLGMTGVYLRFISQYQIKTEPLRRLKRKDIPFIWGEEQEKAFQDMKKSLCLLPTLKQPDFSRTFELHSDAATSAGIAVILCQRYDNIPYPLAFASRSLTIHEQRYSVREQEALSLVFGIRQFRPFLESKMFFIFTDHSSLQWILEPKEDVSPRIWRWAMFLQTYEFKVFYVPGKDSLVADALSRHSVTQNIQSLENEEKTWDWPTLQENDQDIQAIKNNIATHTSFVVKSNTLYKVIINTRNINKNNLFIVVPKACQEQIIKLFHDSVYGGHFGTRKTIAKVKRQRLWWKGMEQEIKKYCITCDLCQRIKGAKNKHYNQSDTTQDYPFRRIALDFWGPIPESSNGNKYILVIIDTFSKFVELYPVKATNQEDLTKTLYERFILRHGIPEEMLSDGGPPFTSLFNTQLSSLLGAKYLFTPAYHPASNGIIERFMATLRRMILTYTEQDIIKTEWDRHLRLIQFVYNTTSHEATGHSPFFLVHGRQAKIPLLSTEENKIFDHYQSTSQDFAIKLQDRLNSAFDLVDTLKNEKQRQASSNPFQVNDQVLIFNQTLSSQKKPRKLMFDWLGPFLVTAIKSKTTVDLKSTNNNKLILNVHIARLKKYNSRST